MPTPASSPCGIAHRPAVLEAEMDVLDLGRDVGEIDGLPPRWQVVADEAPTGPDALHGLWDRLPDDLSELVRDRLHRGREVLEQCLGRHRIHVAIMPDA